MPENPADPGHAGDELAGAMRELIELAMTEQSGADATLQATELVRSATELLRAAGGTRRPPLTTPPSGEATSFFRFSPVSGTSNPLAPPVRFEIREDAVHASCTFGEAYVGPPRYVHGAWVAAVFDELLGITNALFGVPGMTGLLEVRYHLPTPLHVPLTLVGHHTGLSGRKSFASGEMLSGEATVAEAKGTFVAVSESRALELFGRQLEPMRAEPATDAAAGG